MAPEAVATVAIAYARLGDVDHAIPLLKRLSTPPIAAPLLPPCFGSIRSGTRSGSDPRFQELTNQ